MMGDLHTIGMTGIVTSKIPTLNQKEKKDCDRLNQIRCCKSTLIEGSQMSINILSRIMRLVLLPGLLALQAYFKKLTIGNWMIAYAGLCKALQSVKQKLAAFGVQINNTKFKNVFLMHLNDSFHTVCLSILTQTPKSNFVKIKQ
ncbi:hypothetical protein J132_03088 [Termitomyces sp. J132]|nr:hypothetical protein J132_03088 [Termitomyces sp. J132]